MSTHFHALDPDIIRAVLDGVESGMEPIDKANEEAREAILREQCPHCNGDLTPRLPKDPNKVFSRTKGTIKYVKWCRSCERVI